MAMTAATVTGLSMAGHSGSVIAEKNKSVTRLLQHSILQLCNEHIGYSHKLQILGVLCMTVDDEQQELVVKVNNTLKRVNPVAPPPVVIHKDTAGAAVAVVAPPTAARSPSLPASTTVTSTAHNSDNNPILLDDFKETGIHSDSPGPTTSTPTAGRRSHGRKGAKPVKVHHVYDEGDLIPGDDSDITTVIPTDPEVESDEHHQQQNEQQQAEEAMDNDSDDMARGPVTSTPVSAHGSPTQRMMAGGGEVRLSGSAKRKALFQFRSSPQTPSSADNSPLAGSVGTSPNVPPSAVRALLMTTTTTTTNSDSTTTTFVVAPRSVNNTCSSHSNLPTATLNATGVPITPICVAPEADTPEELNHSVLNGDIESESRMYVELSENVIRVKEEPEDDYDYTLMTSSRDTSDDVLSSARNSFSVADTGGMPSQVPYSRVVLSAVSSASDGGLSVQYTSKGPITVTSNGTDVSAASTSKQGKVKDIILYDDRAPLHLQKGARFEGDYMVDKLGFEGRKRRRRGPEDTLTTEEVAEYIGSLDGANGVFKCMVCVEEMNSVTAYLQHTVTMHSAYICHQCGKSFTTKSSLLRHRPIHTGMRRFACSICKKTFYRKDKCKAHIKRHLGAGASPQNVDQYQHTEPIE